MSKKVRLSYPFVQFVTHRAKSPSSKSFISEIYYNSKLQKKITAVEPNSSVDLSYWNLIDQDLSLITKELLVRKQCTELYLCGNKITSQGALILFLKLSNNSTLRTLDLSYNQIFDGGVLSLSQILISNRYSSLKVLSFNKNGISNEGTKYLAEILRMNQTLTELSLADNEIGNNGVKQLANVLAYSNRTLKVLVLSSNIFITDLCTDDLHRMFELNKVLNSLSLNNCNLTESGKRKLREKAERKSKLELVL